MMTKIIETTCDNAEQYLENIKKFQDGETLTVSASILLQQQFHMESCEACYYNFAANMPWLEYVCEYTHWIPKFLALSYTMPKTILEAHQTQFRKICLTPEMTDSLHNHYCQCEKCRQWLGIIATGWQRVEPYHFYYVEVPCKQADNKQCKMYLTSKRRVLLESYSKCIYPANHYLKEAGITLPENNTTLPKFVRKQLECETLSAKKITFRSLPAALIPSLAIMNRVYYFGTKHGEGFSLSDQVAMARILVDIGKFTSIAFTPSPNDQRHIK